MKLYKFAFIPFAMFAAACGGGGSSIDIVGKPPAEQAELIADQICDQQVECGDLSIDCTSDPNTQELTCTATIEDVDYDACISENQAGIEADLTACALSTADQQTVQDCMNALAAESCITQAEADAYADAIEAGSEDPIRPLPAVCDDAFAILDACAG